MQKNTVLVVDPDHELTTALQKLLTSNGYVVRTCHDGEAAIKACEKALPRVLILEGMLPKINGIEVSKQIREMPQGGLVSILLISKVYTGSKFLSEIEKAQIDDTLEKPFSPADVLTKVQALTLSKKISEKQVEEISNSTFSASGSIAEVPFLRIIYHLYSVKASGTLRLQAGEKKKLITFQEGEPKLVVSNLEKECLGQLLVSKGRLSPEECQRSLETMARLKKRQGETLIYLGLLEPYELDEALRQQAREKCSEVFSWREGQYVFVEGKQFRKDLTPIDLSVPQLCLRGVKEHYNLSALKNALAPCINLKPMLSSQSVFSVEGFRLATWDQKLATHIKRGKSISQIVQMKVARELDVYHLFFAFFMLGVIEFESPRELKKEQDMADDNEEESPFEVLSVPVNVTDEEVREIFDKKLAQVEGSEEEQRRLRKAFYVIGSLQGRRDYLIRVYEEEGELPDDAREIFQPKEFLTIGKRFLNKRDFEQAQRVFLDGIALFPEEGMFYSYLGLSILQKLSATGKSKEFDKELEQARKAMIKATHISSTDPEVHYLVAQLFTFDKDYENAIKALRICLQLSPDHKSAGTELRLLQRRAEKKSQSSFIKWKR